MSDKSKTTKRYGPTGWKMPGAAEEQAPAFEPPHRSPREESEIVFSESALRDLERLGLTSDDIVAMMADDFAAKH